MYSTNYTADVHRDWHTIAAAEGTPAAWCPFDCGAAELTPAELAELEGCTTCYGAGDCPDCSPDPILPPAPVPF